MAAKRRQNPRGFTLIEVMVALAVIAIALMAALKATSFSTDSAIDFRTRMLAGWVAQNQADLMTARRDFPDLGEQNGTAEEAGYNFKWHMEIGGSPNRSFHRVEIRVYAADDPNHAAATLVSYVARVGT